MKSTYHNWKVFKLFTIALSAAVLHAELSEAVTEPSIEERLALVREQLGKKEGQFSLQSLPSETFENEDRENILSQWPNWADWTDWADAPPTTGGGSDGANPPTRGGDPDWSDWSDWSDSWGNW